jgi:tetratricopeptide (TPR) repeat protein
VDRILAQDSHNEQARALRVTALLALGRVQEAYELANRLALESPGITTAVFRAQTLAELGRDTECAAQLWKGIDREQPGEVGPSLQARVLLARLYARHGKLVLAEAVLTSAARIRPDPAVLSDLGRLDLARRRYPLAHEHFTEAYGLSRDPAALLGVARALEGLKLERETQEALKSVEDAYRRELQGAQSMGHRRALASLLLDRGESREAVELMQAELKQRRDFDTLMTAARALRMAGRPRAAWPLLEEAWSRGYRDAASWDERARVAEALGDKTEAARCREEAVRLNPAFRAMPDLPSAPVEH